MHKFEPNPDFDEGIILTFKGNKINPLNLQPEDICLEDIAHALSMKCRWGGFCDPFYSVAQHSILVCEEVQRRKKSVTNAKAALLHDASEAYLPDIPAPIKSSFYVRSKYLGNEKLHVSYSTREGEILELIFEKYGIKYDNPSLIKEIDVAIRNDEAAALMEGIGGWDLSNRLGLTIEPWTPMDAEDFFLKKAEELGLT